MSRQQVSKENLIQLMNEYLQENDNNLKDCSITSVGKLSEPDQTGCNWNVAPYGLRCSGVPAELCMEPAIRIIKLFREKYNLE